MSVLIRGVRLYGEGDRLDVLVSDGQIADGGKNDGLGERAAARGVEQADNEVVAHGWHGRKAD